MPGKVLPQKTWETYGAHGRSGCFPETMTVLEEGGTLRMVLGSSASGTRREASFTRWAGVWHHGALCPIYIEFLDDPLYAKGAGDKPRAQWSRGGGGRRGRAERGSAGRGTAAPPRLVSFCLCVELPGAVRDLAFARRPERTERTESQARELKGTAIRDGSWSRLRPASTPALQGG